jgi:hypothetical protein
MPWLLLLPAIPLAGGIMFLCVRWARDYFSVDSRIVRRAMAPRRGTRGLPTSIRITEAAVLTTASLVTVTSLVHDAIAQASAHLRATPDASRTPEQVEEILGHVADELGKLQEAQRITAEQRDEAFAFATMILRQNSEEALRLAIENLRKHQEEEH